MPMATGRPSDSRRSNAGQKDEREPHCVARSAEHAALTRNGTSGSPGSPVHLAGTRQRFSSGLRNASGDRSPGGGLAARRRTEADLARLEALAAEYALRDSIEIDHCPRTATALGSRWSAHHGLTRARESITRRRSLVIPHRRRQFRRSWPGVSLAGAASREFAPALAGVHDNPRQLEITWQPNLDSRMQPAKSTTFDPGAIRRF